MDNFGLSQQTIERINRVFANYEQVEKVFVYGSRAKGTYKNGSDIDLCMLGKDLSYHSQMDIFDDLDELLLPYSIDLSVFHLLNHLPLKEHIERAGKIFYSKPQK